MERKTLVVVLLIMIATLSCSVGYESYALTNISVSASESLQNNLEDGNITLAEVIHQGTSSINWSQDDQWRNRVCLTHFGQIFGTLPLSAYEKDIQTQIGSRNWVPALGGIRMAEIDGYTSPTIDNYTKQVLDNHPMVGYLPDNNGGTFLVYYRDELNGYRYAQKLGYATDRWDIHGAFSQFQNAFAQASTFVWTVGSSGLVRDDDRWYDGGAETLDVFRKFYEDGIPDAMTYADEAWNKINGYPWPGYYPYHLANSSPNVECEIAFETIVGKYAEMKGGTIPYQFRLIQDIDYKLLADGWNSPMWSQGGYTICHVTGSTERREPNTLNAFQVLHTYYPQFNDSMKSSFIQLLTGSTPAWLGLTQTDLCDPTNSYRFRMDSLNSWSDTSLTDTGTAVGDLLLFLEGIVPSTGSLAIPKLDEVYEDVCSSFSVQQFGFDYDAKTIRIPVNAGELKFQFGSILVPYTFPTSQVYQVTFSNDWNRIIDVRGYGSVSVNGTKDGVPVAFDSWVDDEAHVTVGTAGCTFPRVISGVHTVYGMYGATFLRQTVNVRTSQTTAVVFDFDQNGNFTYSPIPATQNSAVTFDASDAATINGTITSYTWDFGDGNSTSITSPIVAHVYVLPGTYNVRLTVENSTGQTDSTWRLVQVLRARALKGDINIDGIVDIYDAILLGGAYGSVPASPYWNANADINGDNIVDIYDALLLAGNYGKSWL